MDYRVEFSKLAGSVRVAPSKSHSQRAILFGALAKGRTAITNYLPSPDTDAMVGACQALGAKIHVKDSCIEIEGGDLKAAQDVIDAGNSGQVVRFVGAVAALCHGYTVITGDHSIRYSRPMQPLLSGIEQLGGFAVSTRGDGGAPIVVRGPLKGGIAVIDGQDSQPISALLIASAFAEASVELRVINPGETPWVSLTLSWFDRLSLPYEQVGFELYRISGRSAIAGFEYRVSGDWSSALYPICAALITNSEITLDGLSWDDAQGDKMVIELLQAMGARMEWDGNRLVIRKGSGLKGVTIDVNRYIDALPMLAVLGCFASGKTEIVNGQIARRKESDRISCIVSELKKMGAQIEEKPDGLIVTHSPLHGADVSSFGDHRLAMALSVAAMGVKGPSIIRGGECAAKSNRSFFEQFKALGAAIQ